VGGGLGDASGGSSPCVGEARVDARWWCSRCRTRAMVCSGLDRGCTTAWRSLVSGQAGIIQASHWLDLGRAGPFWVTRVTTTTCISSALGGDGWMCGNGGPHVAHMSLVRLISPNAVEVPNLLRRHWTGDGGVGVCLSASMTKGGGRRVHLASRWRFTGCLSSLIWPKMSSSRRPRQRTPLGGSCLEIVVSDGIRWCVPMFFSTVWFQDGAA
jgi:hypothetical protein